MSQMLQLGQTRYKPGQSGNPGGRPRLPEDIKEARQLNRVEFERVANKFLYMTAVEIQAAVRAPETTGLELMVGSIIAKGIKNGDHQRLSFVLDRLIGRVKETIAIEGGLAMALPTPEEAARILAADWASMPAPPVVIDDL